MENDISNHVISGHFVIVPEWVLLLPITATALRVYCVIRRHADSKTGECFPSRKLIATKARCSVATVDRCTKELAANGALIVRKRKNKSGDWSSNLYIIVAQPTCCAQPYEQVATKDVPPSHKRRATGGIKRMALTKAITNQKQELVKYTHKEQQDMSLGAALFHTGTTLAEVKEAAQDINGIRELVIGEYLRLCQVHNIQLKE
jgi:hypothetical protein